MNQKYVVEINGKNYDIHTGLVVANSSHVSSEKKSAVEKVNSSVSTAHATHKIPVSHDHSERRHQSSSKLLMRQYVKKPASAVKLHTKTNGALHKPKISIDTIVKSEQIKQRRYSYIQSPTKSESVKHFSSHIPINHYVAKQSKVVIQETKPVHQHIIVNHAATQNRIKHPKTTADILERALKEANSHEQPLYPKPSRQRKSLLNIFSRLNTA